jgi:hypothetical protein
LGTRLAAALPKWAATGKELKAKGSYLRAVRSTYSARQQLGKN